MTREHAFQLTAEMRKCFRLHILAAARHCVQLGQAFDYTTFEIITRGMEHLLPSAPTIAEALDDAFGPAEKHIQSEEFAK